MSTKVVICDQDNPESVIRITDWVGFRRNNPICILPCCSTRDDAVNRLAQRRHLRLPLEFAVGLYFHDK